MTIETTAAPLHVEVWGEQRNVGARVRQHRLVLTKLHDVAVAHYRPFSCGSLHERA